MGHWTWNAWFICYYSENITKFYLPLQPQPARSGHRDLVTDSSEIYLSSESREAANCRLIEREKYNGNTFLFINPTPDPLWGQQSLRGLTQLYTFIRYTKVCSGDGFIQLEPGACRLEVNIYCAVTFTALQHATAELVTSAGEVLSLWGTRRKQSYYVLYITEWKVVTIAGDPLNV